MLIMLDFILQLPFHLKLETNSATTICEFVNLRWWEMSKNFSYNYDHIPSSQSIKVQAQPPPHHNVNYLWINFSIVCTNVVYQHIVGETRDNKVTGDDEVPGDILRMLEENGLRIVTQLAKWPKDFTEVIVITFK